MKKVFVICVLLSLSCAVQAMKKLDETSSSDKGLITLPKASVLKERLEKGGFQHFLEKTKIDEKLADKKLKPLGVLLAVELSLYDYVQDLNNPMMSTMMQMRKPQLIEIILKDSPKALEKLKEKNKK